MALLHGDEIDRDGCSTNDAENCILVIMPRLDQTSSAEKRTRTGPSRFTTPGPGWKLAAPNPTMGSSSLWQQSMHVLFLVHCSTYAIAMQVR